MKTEDKELLLKDLCARLPYGVKVHIDNDGFYDKREPYDTMLTIQSSQFLIDLNRETGPDAIIIKPYLRPMLSMTKNEKLNYRWESLACTVAAQKNPEIVTAYRTDFLNAHHLDFRGLIPMGLALEATEDMYKLD